MSRSRGRTQPGFERSSHGAVTAHRHASARRALVVVATTLAIGAIALTSPPRADASSACGTSNGYTVCVSVTDPTPGPGGQGTGDDVRVSATLSGGSGAREVIFFWGPASSPAEADRLLSDFQAPYQFDWPTSRYADASRHVTVRVVTSTSTGAACCAVPVTLANGNALLPRNPADWSAAFPPAAGDPLIAAVGDGADGTSSGDAVAGSIAGLDPDLLLYLGDVYERGTRAEFEVNYGTSSLDDPGGARAWGALARVTAPTLGNHEAALGTQFFRDAYQDYWHGVPDWYFFEYGGVFFAVLNSECARVGGCGTTSPQYQAAKAALAANDLECIVGIWHRPRLSAAADTTNVDALWRLLANNGGDVIVNGHTHTMQAFEPLNAALQAGRPDSHMVELVSGAGAHNMVSTLDGDARSAWQANKVPGVAYLTAVGGGSGPATRLDWEFLDVSHDPVIDKAGAPGAGSVDCSEPPPPTGVIFQDGFADLSSWRVQGAVTLDGSRGATAPPSARLAPSGVSALGTHGLGATFGSLCMTEAVRLESRDGSVGLMRLRTAANGPVARAYVTATGKLAVRSDVSGASAVASSVLPTGSWHSVQLCATTGTSGSASVWLDDVRVANLASTDTGTSGIGTVAFGDPAAKTFVLNVDDVVVTTP